VTHQIVIMIKSTSTIGPTTFSGLSISVIDVSKRNTVFSFHYWKNANSSCLQQYNISLQSAPATRMHTRHVYKVDFCWSDAR